MSKVGPTSPRLFDAITVSKVFVTPSMVRVRFGGPGLDAFKSTGVPDERLRLVFGEGEDRAIRSYTVRAFDSRGPFLDVDFVVHDGGIAAAWALHAQPGDQLSISEARGWYRPPSDSNWLLLVADMTALPALTRAIEQLPADSRAFVIASVPTPADEQIASSRGIVSYQWLYTDLPENQGTGSTAIRPSLPEAVENFRLPAGPGYVWAACESSEARSIRKYFHRDLSWNPDRFEIKGYWRRDKERWQQRYAQVEKHIDAVREQALADGKSGFELSRIMDDALENSGL